jgi:hypothetical protein
VTTARTYILHLLFAVAASAGTVCAGNTAGVIWRIPGDPDRIMHAGSDLLSSPTAIGQAGALSLVNAKHTGAAIAHTSWIAGTSVSTLAGNFAFGDHVKAGIGLRYFGAPVVNNSDALPAVDYGAMQADAALLVRVTPRYTAGVSLHYLNEYTDGATAPSANGMDHTRHWPTIGLAIHAAFTPALSAAISANHIGPSRTFDGGDAADSPPTSIRAELAWNRTWLTIASGTARDDEGTTGFGTVVVRPSKFLSISSGFRGEPGESALSTFAAGAQLHMRPGLLVSYAFRPSDLGTIHSMGLRWQLHRIRRQKHHDDARFASETIRSRFDDVLTSAPLDTGIVVIRPLSTDHVLVRRELIRSILARGLSVDRTARSGVPHLVYEIVEIDLATETSGSHLLGTHSVTRRLRTDIRLFLHNADGQLVWVRTVRTDHDETISSRFTDTLKRPAAIARRDTGGRNILTDFAIVAGLVGISLLLW